VRFLFAWVAGSIVFMVLWGFSTAIGPIHRPVGPNSALRCDICGAPAVITTLGETAERMSSTAPGRFVNKFLGTRAWCQLHSSEAAVEDKRSAKVICTFVGLLFGAMVYVLSKPHPATTG
jgi:hypothetical protein